MAVPSGKYWSWLLAQACGFDADKRPCSCVCGGGGGTCHHTAIWEPPSLWPSVEWTGEPHNVRGDAPCWGLSTWTSQSKRRRSSLVKEGVVWVPGLTVTPAWLRKVAPLQPCGEKFGSGNLSQPAERPFWVKLAAPPLMLRWEALYSHCYGGCYRCHRQHQTPPPPPLPTYIVMPWSDVTRTLITWLFCSCKSSRAPWTRISALVFQANHCY